MLNNENSYLFLFAWRSIRRNAGRSFFIGFSVALAVFIAVWVVAFFDGLNHQIEEAVVNTNVGYFQLQEKTFASTTDASRPLKFADYEKQVSSLPHKGFSPELVLDGNISTPEGAASLSVVGIEPSLHSQFLPIHEKLTQGSFIAPEDEGSVVIGKELADLFQFQTGDQIVLNYQDIKGELRSELLQIKGIYQYSSRSFQKKYIYINQKTWQQLFFNQATQDVLFNRIVVMTDSLKVAPLIDEKFKKSDLEIKTWKNLNPEMGVILEFHEGMIRFFFLIVGITITMTILTPVQMLWQERLKELRMLNILGISSKKFWKIGLFEIVQMIFSSGVMATILLTVIIGIQSQTGMDFRFMNEGVSAERAGIKLPGIIYPKLSADQILMTFGFVIVVLSISYLWSIHRTLKKLEVAP